MTTWKDFAKVSDFNNIIKSARDVSMNDGSVHPHVRNRVNEQREVDSINRSIDRIRDMGRRWDEYIELANRNFGGNMQLTADATDGGLKQVYPDLWIKDAALAKHLTGLILKVIGNVDKSRIFRQMRHSPTWKAKRVLSKIPTEDSKIMYGNARIENIIPAKPGTSRVYRGSGVDSSGDFSRNGVLWSESGYGKNARGLYGYQGWRGRYEDYWGMFPDEVKRKILEQMRVKMLVTGSPEHASLFSRGGGGKYIHVYDIPKREYDALRWTGDAGQQRGILEYAKKSLEEGEGLGRIPVPFGKSSVKGGIESSIDRSSLINGYSGSVHPMYSHSRLQEGLVPGDRMFRRGLRDENRLGRIAGFSRDRTWDPGVHSRYNMRTYYMDPSEIKTYSPVEDTLERIRKLERSGYGNTWLDRLTEIISPTVQR